MRIDFSFTFVMQGVKNKDEHENTTIGAVGANAICPGIAVLFARGTAEPGKQPPHPHIVTTIKA